MNSAPAFSSETGPLVGSAIRLDPLCLDHIPGLLAAANEDPSPYAWTPVAQTPAAMESYVQAALAGRSRSAMTPYAIMQGERVVGTTRFYAIERWAWPATHAEHARRTPDVCEIGYTWLARSSIRTGVNTQAKRLLLEHAFDVWQVHRVSFRTDVRNAVSRAAIERLGAQLDGVIRAERIASDASVRDSVLYSIIAAEWPAVRARLRALEARSNTTR